MRGKVVQLLSSPLLISLGCAALALLLFAELAEEVLEGEAQRFDDWVRLTVHAFASPTVTAIMRIFTLLGSVAVVSAVTVAAALGFSTVGRRRRAALVLVSFTGAAFLMFLMKLSFQRFRPEPFFGEVLPWSYSFPSGHALVSFCVYGILTAFATAHQSSRPVRALLWTLTAILVLGIGFSRIYLGVHHASDVVAGYLAALVWMIGVWIAYRRLGRQSSVRQAGPDAT